MLFPYVVFTLSWASFFLFADKKKFTLYLPTCYFAILLALTSDIIVQHYPFWQYAGNVWVEFLDDLGVYFVVPYLFLQTLPTGKNGSAIAKHIFLWSLLGLFLEWLAVRVGFMKYDLGWSLATSYLADWVLYYIFYRHYKLLIHLRRTTEQCP